MNCEELFNLVTFKFTICCLLIPSKATHWQVVTVPDDLYMGFVVGTDQQNIADLNKKLLGQCVIFLVGPIC